MTDRLIDLKEVKARVSLGTTKIYELMKLEQFPRQIKLGRQSLWSEAEISTWIEAQKTARFTEATRFAA